MALCLLQTSPMQLRPFAFACTFTCLGMLAAPPIARADNWRVQSCLNKYDVVKPPDLARYAADPKAFRIRLNELNGYLQMAVDCVNALSPADNKEGWAELQKRDKEKRELLKTAEQNLQKVVSDLAAFDQRAKTLDDRARAKLTSRSEWTALGVEIESFRADLTKAGVADAYRNTLASLDSVYQHAESGVRDGEWKGKVSGIADLAVTKRLPDYKAEDVLDLAKVEAAFLAAKADELVYLKAYDYTWDGLVSESMPTSQHAKDALDRAKESEVRSAEIWRVVEPYSGEGSRRDFGLEAYVPALVWSADGDKIITVDVHGQVHRTTVVASGYHQRTKEIAFERGLAPADKFQATTAKNTHLSTGDLAALEQAGQIKAGTVVALQGIAAKLDKCSAAVWDRAEGQFKALDAANITMATRENRREQLYDKLRAQAIGSCGGQIKAFAATYGSIAKARLASRAKLAKKLRAHVDDLTAGRP